MVLQGSEAKQQTEQNISSKVENEQIYFPSNVIGKVVTRTSQAEQTRLTRPRRGATHLSGANIAKPPPLAVVILLVISGIFFNNLFETILFPIESINSSEKPTYDNYRGMVNTRMFIHLLSVRMKNHSERTGEIFLAIIFPCSFSIVNSVTALFSPKLKLTGVLVLSA